MPTDPKAERRSMAPPVGFEIPLHDVSWWCPLGARGSQVPCYGPSSAFLPPSTVCSTTGLVGLFRPTAVFRVSPSRGFPSRRSRTRFPWPRAFVPLDASGLRLPRPTERALDFKALLPAGVR
jgi:hypothetical protein